MLIKIRIVNEPYRTRENDPTGLRDSPISPFMNTIIEACEHTPGYNSSPIAIIVNIPLVWVLIKIGIVNEPYRTRENGPTGLRESVFVLTKESLS